jgi:hypothetical protein
MTEVDLIDRPPVARCHPHALLEEERREIRAAAAEDELAHLRHRKLAHALSRQARVFCSESSVLRELRCQSGTGWATSGRRTAKPQPVLTPPAPVMWSDEISHEAEDLGCRPDLQQTAD